MTVVFTDRRCLRHAVPLGFPEVPERLTAVLAGLERHGYEVRRPGPHAGTEAALAATHGQAYVDRLRAAVERGDGLVDSPDNPLSKGTVEAATAAVDATLHAADHAAFGGFAFAAVRPPGHHADRDTAMGFCYFNNAAAAVGHLRRVHGARRVAVFDFDVHHGNGTQDIFYRDADVLYASTHQFPFYPGTGRREESGEGPGQGTTVNLPLPAGSDDAAYEEALESTVLPAVEHFAPDVLVISAGFDAWRADPLGGMRVTEAAFRHWGDRLGSLARRLCGGRLLAVLEGGYDLDALGGLAAGFLAGLDAKGEAPLLFDSRPVE